MRNGQQQLQQQSQPQQRYHYHYLFFFVFFSIFSFISTLFSWQLERFCCVLCVTFFFKFLIFLLFFIKNQQTKYLQFPNLRLGRDNLKLDLALSHFPNFIYVKILEGFPGRHYTENNQLLGCSLHSTTEVSARNDKIWSPAFRQTSKWPEEHSWVIMVCNKGRAFSLTGGYEVSVKNKNLIYIISRPGPTQRLLYKHLCN